MRQRNVYVINGERARPHAGRARTPTGKAKRQQQSRRRPAANAHGNAAGWPRLAASCSILVAGSGHFLHRRWKAGAFYSGTLALALAFHYFLRASWPALRSFARRYELGESDLLVGVFLIDLFVTMVLVLGVYSAYRVGRACAGADADPVPIPLVAGFASLLVPGWGQVVNGQISKAMVFLFLFYTLGFSLFVRLLLPGPIERLLLGFRESLEPIVFLFGLAAVGILVWGLSLYDALLVAHYRRR